MFNSKGGFSYTLAIFIFLKKTTAYLLRPFKAMRAIRPTKINRAIVGTGSSESFNLERPRSDNRGMLRTEPPPAALLTSAIEIPGLAWNLNITEPKRGAPTISRLLKMAMTGTSNRIRNSKSVPLPRIKSVLSKTIVAACTPDVNIRIRSTPASVLSFRFIFISPPLLQIESWNSGRSPYPIYRCSIHYPCANTGANAIPDLLA